MPGTRMTWKETEAVNIPTCPGCARSDSRCEVVADHLAGQLDPGPALTADALQDEVLAREDPGGEGLLEPCGDLDARCAGQEPVPVHQVLGAGADLGPHDAARQLGRERDGPRRVLRGVGAQEQRR